MKKNEPIKNIIKDKVITANVTDKYSTVVSLMEDNGIHHLPIVSGKDLIGVISSVDLMKVSFSNVYVSSETGNNEILGHTIDIKNIMQDDLVTINQTQTVKHAAEILSTSHFNSLPVVNDAKELVGIVTSKDLIIYLLDQY